jgi:two-component system sensor histidine kinase KdpD
MSPERSTSFLQLIRRSERGKLKVYLGYAAGVGKTSLMLHEGHRLRKEGVDVVAAWVESHGRSYVEDLLGGLERLPARSVRYHGVATEDLDLDGLLKRRPQVALIDELAHSNPPGSRHDKRYQDVQEIRAAGIHVISTLNVQHLESLYDTVERMTAVKVRERLPDLVLNDSDEVVNVDLAVTDLLKRLREGLVMPLENVEQALKHFYRPDSLEQLRELALRELASSIDFRRREETSDPGWSEQFLVALGPNTGSHAALLRYASRMAGRLSRNWYAVHVRRPGAKDESPLSGRRPMDETLTLANQLGAVVFTVKGADVVEALLDFARRYRVGNLIVGKPGKLGWRPWSRGGRVVERLLGIQGFSVQVVDTGEGAPGPKTGAKERPPQGTESGNGLGGLLMANQVLILDQAVRHRDLVLSLAMVALEGTGISPIIATDAVMERESRGSTFLNSGLALPHASLEGLDVPRLALALPRAGLKDYKPSGPFEAVFLLLTPLKSETRHLEMLSAIGRAFQDAALRSALGAARTPEQVLDALDSASWFNSAAQPRSPF